MDDISTFPMLTPSAEEDHMTQMKAAEKLLNGHCGETIIFTQDGIVTEIDRGKLILKYMCSTEKQTKYVMI